MFMKINMSGATLEQKAQLFIYILQSFDSECRLQMNEIVDILRKQQNFDYFNPQELSSASDFTYRANIKLGLNFSHSEIDFRIFVANNKGLAVEHIRARVLSDDFWGSKVSGSAAEDLTQREQEKLGEMLNVWFCTKKVAVMPEALKDFHMKDHEQYMEQQFSEYFRANRDLTVREIEGYKVYLANKVQEANEYYQTRIEYMKNAERNVLEVIGQRITEEYDDYNEIFDRDFINGECAKLGLALRVHSLHDVFVAGELAMPEPTVEEPNIAAAAEVEILGVDAADSIGGDLD